MKNRKIHSVLAVILCFVLTAVTANSSFAVEYPVYGTVSVEDSLNVRSGPGTQNQKVASLSNGTTVIILATQNDKDGDKWYKINYDLNDSSKVGFVYNPYVIVTNQQPQAPSVSADFEEYMTQQGFPESYKPYLRTLHSVYPKWRFTADKTGLSWNGTVSSEMVLGRSLVAKSSKDSWKSVEDGAYNFETKTYVGLDGSSWVAASRQIVEYYMDPRNFLNVNGIFQFLEHSYDSSAQSKALLNEILKNSFMDSSKSFPEAGYATYADVLMKAAEISGANPYVLASMIIVEQGYNGEGKSISGNQPGYVGYYNYFNIGAYATSSMSAVQRGLWYAKGGDSNKTTYLRPWNSRVKSITGGATYYAENFIKAGQNTLYLKKFNVSNGVAKVGTNQYMTNIQGAESEALYLKKAYNSIMNSTLCFSIPVFEGMPATACAKPTSDGDNLNYLSQLSVSNHSITPSFDKFKTEYELVVNSNISSINVNTSCLSPAATVSGGGVRNLNYGNNVIRLDVTAGSGAVRTYILNVNRKQDGSSGDVPLFSSSVYTIGAKYITGVSLMTKTAEFKSRFSTSNCSVQVLGPDGKEKKPEEYVGTGCVVRFSTADKAVGSYEVVIYGDINGDGKISIIDLARVQRHILGVVKLSDAYLESGDCNKDGRISIIDLARVQRHILGAKPIEQ